MRIFIHTVLELIQSTQLQLRFYEVLTKHSSWVLVLWLLSLMGFMHLSILINRLGNSYRPFVPFLCGPFLSFHNPLCGQLLATGLTPSIKSWASALGSPKLVLKFYVKSTQQA